MSLRYINPDCTTAAIEYSKWVILNPQHGIGDWKSYKRNLFIENCRFALSQKPKRWSLTANWYQTKEPSVLKKWNVKSLSLTECLYWYDARAINIGVNPFNSSIVIVDLDHDIYDKDKTLTINTPHGYYLFFTDVYTKNELNEVLHKLDYGAEGDRIGGSSFVNNRQMLLPPSETHLTKGSTSYKDLRIRTWREPKRPILSMREFLK